MEGTCHTCKSWQKHFYRKHFDAKGKKFLKVIAKGFSDGMIISEKFIKQCKLEQAKAVDLKGPSGCTWRVKLRKDVDYMFHGDVWGQFLSQNQVERGDYLVFDYDGDSCFSVSMFDGGGLEKIAPYFAKDRFLDTKIDKKKQLEDDSPEDSSSSGNDSQECSSSENYSPEDSSSSGSLSDSSYYSSENYSLEDPSSPGNLSASRSEPTPEKCLKSNKRKKAASETKQNTPSSKQAKTEKPTWSSVFVSKSRPVTDAEKARAINQARKIRLSNPSFLTVMRPTHVYRRFFMTIPAGFAGGHITRKKQTIILRIPDQKREWHVGYGLNTSASGLYGLAWRQFVYDNNLEEGDACVFELTGSLRVLAMDVHIFRVVEKIEPLTVEERK